MAKRSYEAQVVEWALAQLGGGAAARRGRPRPPSPVAPDAALARLVERFALVAAEARVVQLLWAAEHRPEVVAAARARYGGGGVVVETIEAPPDDALLGPRGRLRAHGLIEVDGAPGALARSGARVRLAAGLAPRLAGLPLLPELLGAGVESVGQGDRGPLPEALQAVVRDDAVGDTPRWLCVSGVSRAEVLRLSAAMARRLGRDAIHLDGATLHLWPAADAFALLAAARREADLEGSLLVVEGCSRLAGLLRALAAPAVGPVRVLLTDEGRLPELAVPVGFLGRVISLLATAAESPSVAVAVSPSPAIESARRQAALDAARAMGRPLDLPPAAAAAAPEPAPAAPPVAPMAASGRPEAPPVAPMAASSRPGASPAAAVEGSPPQAGDGRSSRDLTLEERRARAAAHVGTSVPASRRGPAARPRSAPAETESVASPAPVAAPAAPASSGSAAPDPLDEGGAPGGAVDGAAGAPDPAESLPYVPLPEAASLADLLRVIREAGNPLQRAALIRQLADAGVKDVGFVALLRAFVKSEHAAVRGAAEYAMVRVFGPSWNRTRPIPRPIQPPHGDGDPPR